MQYTSTLGPVRPASDEEAIRARLDRGDALQDALEEYCTARPLANVVAELGALNQILELPEIVYQAAFAPDLSGEGPY